MLHLKFALKREISKQALNKGYNVNKLLYFPVRLGRRGPVNMQSLTKLPR